MHSTSNDDGIIALSDIETEYVPRYVTGFADNVWGNDDDPGIPITSVTLLGAAPGFGKTTICFQILSSLAKVTGRPGLYVGAEESGKQLKNTARRLELDNLDKILILPLEKQAQGYKFDDAVMKRYNPCAVIVDSAQAYSGQNQDAAVEIARQLKLSSALYGSPHIMIGQMTKEDEFEGSNKLLHQVDALLVGSCVDELEIDGVVHDPPVLPGGRIEPFRIVAAKTKNRFGALNETYFTMTGLGLVPFSPKPPKKERKRHG